MSTCVRSPARFWISITVAVFATGLSLVAGVSFIVPAALWIGVVFDWDSSHDYVVARELKQVLPRPARDSWLPARDSQVA